MEHFVERIRVDGVDVGWVGGRGCAIASKLSRCLIYLGALLTYGDHPINNNNNISTATKLG